jgi:hypothetical protein
LKLSAEQKIFLHKVCVIRNHWRVNKETNMIDVSCSVNMANMKLTKIPVKFGRVEGNFNCYNNQLTTLKNCPDWVGVAFVCWGNPLTDYFKTVKKEDFKLWDSMVWRRNIEQMLFLINIAKNYISKNTLRWYLNSFPKTKLYYKD